MNRHRERVEGKLVMTFDEEGQVCKVAITGTAADIFWRGLIAEKWSPKRAGARETEGGDER
jgi:hypothetical protein